MPYSECAIKVACESSISAVVLLSSANDDIAFMRLKPLPSAGFITPEDFTARKLRSVGVVGLCGTKPMVAFSELLEPPVVDAIAWAFLEYVRVLLGEHMEAALVTELERLYALSDTRPN
jgi:hypothetical protein